MALLTSIFAFLQALFLIYCSWVVIFYGTQLVWKVYDRIRGQSRITAAWETFKKDASQTAQLAGYPKARNLIGNLRLWILQSDYAQKCYFQVTRTFAQDLIESGIQDIKILELKDVHNFFENTWPTFLPASQSKKEGAAPFKDNKIYIPDTLLDAYERDQARGEQWRHILLTVVLHELAIALSKSMLPALGRLPEHYHPYAETGWHLEDLLLGGTLEVEWPAERQGRLDQVVRLVISTINEQGSRDFYDLGNGQQQEGRVPLGSPLTLWTNGIDETVLKKVKGNVFPKFQGFVNVWTPKLQVQPPAGWSRNRATLAALPKPPGKPSWIRKRRAQSPKQAANSKAGREAVSGGPEGRHVASGSSGEPSWVMTDNGEH